MATKDAKIDTSPEAAAPTRVDQKAQPAKPGRLNSLLRSVKGQVYDEAKPLNCETGAQKSSKQATEATASQLGTAKTVPIPAASNSVGSSSAALPSDAPATIPIDKNGKKRRLDPAELASSNSIPRATTPQSNILDSAERSVTQRRMSWAFWSASDESPRTMDRSLPPRKTVATPVERTGNAIAPTTAKRSSVAASGSIPDGQEKLKQPEPKDRSRSWSFWASKHAERVYPFQPNVIVRSTATAQVGADAIETQTSVLLQESASEGTKTSKKKGKEDLPKRPNLIVPSFKETLPPSTTFSSIVSGFKRAKVVLGYPGQRQLHLFRRQAPIKFKRVLVIGVHGFFPNRVLRPILGEPTGTSMKFAQVAERAILSWARDNDLKVEIQKIALEKEGKIFDRVDFFYDILKRSAEDIKQADFIFVCAHSQGTPVAVMLMSKLLEYGVIDENKRIGILGMAGINNGPFYGMEQSLFVRAYSTFENESMLELFQFQNFESLQSRKYLESIRNLVRHNAKITFAGSIDDQLVPLYSSIASHVKHPNIYKAVYIDGGSDTPDFVARIVKVSCMLQNLGYSDHDVIKEISYALAGPLTGGGHSTIYNDLDVYKLALDFTLKTEDSQLSVEEPVMFKSFDLKRLGSNPFNLPWCVRGLFFEAIRRLHDGRREIDLVFKEFEEWNPDSKALKDVKYRLNGIKAKL
ncbi:DEKNAAC102261 [Brettanomyces naardenensis]|uniref:DEKNAAC102261 n=1 Tax=Brettanomyces naardenensis TaxID=13370 RepID=A0A448YLA6_BRENA|nr:DEKNAAC102261 [Brettanomyces naardenensis]